MGDAMVRTDSRQPTADSKFQPAARSSQRGQASLEMAITMMGAVLLLFGVLKVFLWFNSHLIGRQIAYEHGSSWRQGTRDGEDDAARRGDFRRGRVHAASASAKRSVVMWDDPQERLNILNE